MSVNSLEVLARDFTAHLKGASLKRLRAGLAASRDRFSG
jgi:hypothetical protein